MPVYTISTQAYAKAVLHSAKYHDSTVHGILLSDPASSSATAIRVIDAVPVAHLWTDLSPMFEVALQQIQLYAKERKLQIGGYYVAYESINEKSLSPSGQVFANTILKLNPAAIALVIDGSRLSPGHLSTPAIIPFVAKPKEANSWAAIPVNTEQQRQQDADSNQYVQLENMDVLTKTSNLLRIHDQLLLDDFDSHLESPTADWLQNLVISERINVA
ncbi:hypothetical protein EV182_002034 [Spiromyces aspiralis]|uniref:Uncharacterized protein n=1 Tax=Spiromyces aspiralis TaxID=68401 RepID=A0ACC1HL76_9FUNG|nr:hypothetical protein EV182_002034 [Spiromyces aspiralis]